MTILNPFECENCKRKLQPEDIFVSIENGKLVRICRFCENKVEIETKKNGQ